MLSWYRDKVEIVNWPPSSGEGWEVGYCPSLEVCNYRMIGHVSVHVTLLCSSKGRRRTFVEFPLSL